MAHEFGFDFTEADNERLKGVSRTRSLEILLEIGGKTINNATKAKLADQKNSRYVDYISRMDMSELLPGAAEYLQCLRAKKVKIALGSASRNAPLILERIGISYFFDAIVDGNKVSKAKPDPEVFLRAAEGLHVAPAECMVFEDAEAGIEAAHRACMSAVGIGNASVLKDADIIISGLFALAIILPSEWEPSAIRMTEDASDFNIQSR